MSLTTSAGHKDTAEEESGMKSLAGFPREIAPGIFWLGDCNSSSIAGGTFHIHTGIYLLVGSDRTLLIDTGYASAWHRKMKKQVETVLKERPLDFVMPTHPEIPHSSALPHILSTYPAAKVIGDISDYHLYFPQLEDRLIGKKPGEELDLGGLSVRFIEATIRDLPNTMWIYEKTQKVMFVSDAFSYAHDIVELEPQDEVMHRPGHCAMTSSELPGKVNVQKASYIVRAALHWTRFVDPNFLFNNIEDTLRKYPTNIIAPAHGNVIDDINNVWPVVREIHQLAYIEAKSGKFSLGN
jgi:hypothetical protein